MFVLLIAGALATATPSPEPSNTAAPAPAPVPSPAPSGTPALAACTTAKVTAHDEISSKTAQPGEPFRFTVASIDSGGAFKNVAPGNDGWGVISVVRRGRTGGEAGLLVLETRFIIGSDGVHVPATLARTVSGLFMGKTHNSPPGVGWIPFVGYAASAYDAFHKGGDIVVGPSDSLTVVLGDEADVGACSLPTPPP